MKKKNFRKILLVFIYILGLWFSCAFGRLIRFEHDLSKADITVYPSINLFESEREKAILAKGDIDAYNFVRDSIALDSISRYPTHLFFSMVMADVYNNPIACYDVFKAIKDIYAVEGIEMDNESQMLSLHYLRKGEKLGDMQCKEEIKSLAQQHARK